ncbi:MAG: PD-(D/E)XK nuclease family protein [Actinobacteria bacterium]|nr:PD-(D/E)XK nuclease family protein [Actinomycetota bacterium]
MDELAPVDIGFPRSLSPSRASDFQNCPLLFRLRSIDRLPEAPSAAAIRGTLVHSALEELMDRPPGTRTTEVTRDLLRDALLALREADPDAFGALTEGMKDDRNVDQLTETILRPLYPLVDTYFTLEDPRRITPHAREMAISAELEPGFVGRGFIDRVEISSDGRVRIVDYKTGRAPGPRFEGKAMFQMRFYALMWWRSTGTVPSMLQLMYLGDGQILRLEPSEEQLIATEVSILGIRDAIRVAVAEGFKPTPSKLCNWCSFKEFCPAFEGSPPPFPGVEEILETSRREGA